MSTNVLNDAQSIKDRDSKKETNIDYFCKDYEQLKAVSNALKKILVHVSQDITLRSMVTCEECSLIYGLLLALTDDEQDN